MCQHTSSHAVMHSNCRILQYDYSYMKRWDAINFNWNHLRAFLVTAEEGTLSAAARALNVSQPTLGRQVSALEEEIGVALFERLGSGLSLTTSGQGLVDYARSMGHAATQFSLAASGQSQAVEGTVCISVGELFAAYIMPPIIERLQTMEPGINVELVASNESKDLKRREADIAFRAYHTCQPNLVSFEVCKLVSRFYASSEYLNRIGHSNGTEHRFIGFDDSGGYLQFLNGLGLSLTENNFPIRAGSHFVQWAMAKQGLGIVTALELIGDADAGMECVWPDMSPIISPMHLVAHREVMTNRRIRIVFEFLKGELASL
jgi:DNA-binding transcriptional LysR family regulator